MPRKLDPCLFCGTLPCSCEGAAVKKPVRKKAKPSESLTTASSATSADTSFLVEPAVQPTQQSLSPKQVKAAMRQMLDTSVQAASSMLPSEALRTTINEAAASQLADDEELERAVSILEPLLHPEEKARYSDILNQPASRALRWKVRNGR